MFDNFKLKIQELKAVWDKVQSLADLDGDLWMGAFTAVIIFRLAAVVFGKAPMTAPEAAAYASAISAFAYSNKGPK